MKKTWIAQNADEAKEQILGLSQENAERITVQHQISNEHGLGIFVCQHFQFCYF